MNAQAEAQHVSGMDFYLNGGTYLALALADPVVKVILILNIDWGLK